MVLCTEFDWYTKVNNCSLEVLPNPTPFEKLPTWGVNIFKSNANWCKKYFHFINSSLFILVLQCNIYHNIVSILTCYGKGKILIRSNYYIMLTMQIPP